MVVLRICKNEDPIKNEGTWLLTLYFDFSDGQRQLPP